MIGQIFGIDPTEAERIIERAATAYPASVEMFQEGLRIVGPVAVKAGLSLGETVAELGSLYSQGYSESISRHVTCRDIAEAAPISTRLAFRLLYMRAAGEMIPVTCGRSSAGVALWKMLVRR
jgi:hypothetical protein